VELVIGHSGTRNSCRKGIPSSGELALTNKERIVGLLGQFRLAPPYYSCPTSRRSNESKNLSVRREAECSVIEAEDKESAKGERFETYHLGLVTREKREAMIIVLVPPKGSVLDLVVKNLT